MRIYQTKSFKRWVRSEKLTDSDLVLIIDEMEKGLVGDNLGGSVYKKRVSLEGRGKSSGARTIIVYRADTRAFFVEGFAKNEKTNISDKEEAALKLLAKHLLKFTDDQIKKAVKAEELYEVARG